MLGFHADGIRLFGASDTLVAALKKHKLPLVKLLPQTHWFLP